jgi:hypothetical protein
MLKKYGLVIHSLFCIFQLMNYYPFHLKVINIFVHFIGGFGYWNGQIGYFSVQHVCLC